MTRAAVSLLVLLFAATPVLCQQLPRSVLPTHYDLTFTPDFATEGFDGDATIHVLVAEPVKEVVLHAVALDLDARVGEQTASVTTDAGLAKLTVPTPLGALLAFGRR